MLKSREERIAHIDLTTDCVVGKKWRKSIFLEFLEIEDDVSNWKYARIERCHLCQCHSRNGSCVNPKHVYIGTTKENAADRPQDYLIDSGRRLGLTPQTDKIKANKSKGAQKRTDYSWRQQTTLRRISDGKIFSFTSQKEASETLNLSKSSVSNLVSGKKKEINGFEVHHT